jgi:hypothetical protein
MALAGGATALALLLAQPAQAHGIARWRQQHPA